MTPKVFIFACCLIVAASAMLVVNFRMAYAETGALAGDRHRVVVSSDIGGSDPDDFQSMVHLLLYADVLQIEGLISSPWGPGRREHIVDVIERYELDYPNLKTHSSDYPTPAALRAIAKQGAIEVANYSGVGRPTEGSEWIIECARRDDPRPLHVLIWGGIEDLAQSLHDAPDILPKLRVYWIGGPNKKWSPDAYQYIVTQHPDLWFIESNATYRGWFTGGHQDGEWGNEEFVTRHIAGCGALGDYFSNQLDGVIKMGDTPSVGWLLNGDPSDPSKPGWGGHFVRAWARPHVVVNRLTTAADQIELFGVLELVLPLGDNVPTSPDARMEIENQSLVGHSTGDGLVRFRFVPKDAKKYRYTIHSKGSDLDGKTGEFTSTRPSSDGAQRPSPQLPNWWTDDPSPATAEQGHIGAKTVNQWREDFLRDFARRMRRCKSPAPQ